MAGIAGFAGVAGVAGLAGMVESMPLLVLPEVPEVPELPEVPLLPEVPEVVAPVVVSVLVEVAPAVPLVPLLCLAVCDFLAFFLLLALVDFGAAVSLVACGSVLLWLCAWALPAPHRAAAMERLSKLFNNLFDIMCILLIKGWDTFQASGLAGGA